MSPLSLADFKKLSHFIQKVEEKLNEPIQNTECWFIFRGDKWKSCGVHKSNRIFVVFFRLLQKIEKWLSLEIEYLKHISAGATEEYSELGCCTSSIIGSTKKTLGSPWSGAFKKTRPNIQIRAKFDINIKFFFYLIKLPFILYLDLFLKK